MTLYPIIIVIHIISAVAWLSFLPIDFILRKNIRETESAVVKKKLLNIWLKSSNLLGIAGMTGILITGIIMVSLSSYYNFFQFSINHWLATKQVFMVVLIITTFAFLIPNAKKLSAEIGTEIDDEAKLNESINLKIEKLGRILSVMNVLVLINFLLAITHKFI